MENDKIVIKKKFDKKRALFILSILIVPAIMFAFFYVYVNFNSFLLSFQSVDIEENYKFVGFDNYKAFFNGIMTGEQAGKSLLNSIKMWCISFGISLPLYLIISFYIVKKMPASKITYFIVLIPQVVSTLIYALVYKQLVTWALPDIMKSLGFENFPDLIAKGSGAKVNFINNMFFSIWLSFGTSTLIFVNAMNSIDGEMLESASIDGVNDRQEFFHILLPNIWPTLTTYVVTGVTSMFTWSGSLMVFYMYEANPEIWGLEYYFTVTVKTSNLEFMNYPMVATSGMFVLFISVPLVFGVKALMNKFDKTV